jgi:hypothetical protein
MSAFRVKETLQIRPVMSASDPKRTWAGKCASDRSDMKRSVLSFFGSSQAADQDEARRTAANIVNRSFYTRP